VKILGILLGMMMFAGQVFADINAEEFKGASLQTLPIQDAGRIKPFDTFAREALELIYGKQKYEGRPAHEIVMTWLLDPNSWKKKEFFEIRHNQVKSFLKFDQTRRYFTLNEIFENDRLVLLLQELAAKRETKEKLDPYFQAVQRLESQLSLFKEVAAGRMLGLIPPVEGGGNKWKDVAEFDETENAAFLELTKAFVTVLGAVVKGENDIEVKKQELNLKVAGFMAMAKTKNPTSYADFSRIKLELHYNQFHPYKWAWLLYALAAFIALIAWTSTKDWAYKSAWAVMILGMGFHIYGFILRMILTGRPPVSNMYETVVWVGFGAVLFSMIMEYINKWKFILFGGGLVGAFCLILADIAPAVLDPSIHPLEPVLRSNFWLTIHVMVITISYSAFFLAFILGDMGLVYTLMGEDKYKEKLQVLSLGVYRAMQIGVALLAPGIILGGIWADYSWGRFWGWDPKETWALIALLGYTAVLHGRLAGWLKDFGTIVTSVVSFSLVIMAWYGVNFVLGAGLHSYGFGAGGVEYVSAFVAAHLLFTLFVVMVRQGKLKEKAV
jgi:cytochrome c-type biogenesis protein CcsB